MGSLDLSWLAEVGPAASMQRQPSAAEIVMGQQPQMPVELPPAPALCTTYPPFHNQATVAADHSRHAGHQVLNNPGAQPSPLVGSHAGGGLTDVECAVLMQHQAVLQQHVHNYMAAAAAAGVLPGVSRPFIDVSDALRCSSPLGGAPGMPAWPAASQGFVPGGFMAVPGGGTSVPVPVSTPSMSPERPPTFTSSSQSGGTAEAMALWAQQNALMQALSSSDMNTAAHAVGALTAGTGGMLGIRPMGAAGFGAQQCPFQVSSSSSRVLVISRSQGSRFMIGLF